MSKDAVFAGSGNTGAIVLGESVADLIHQISPKIGPRSAYIGANHMNGAPSFVRKKGAEAVPACFQHAFSAHLLRMFGKKCRFIHTEKIGKTRQIARPDDNTSASGTTMPAHATRKTGGI